MFTYYISKSPTIPKLIDAILHIDLNPPLIYVVTRASLTLFGDNPVAARMPSMVAFLIASLGFFVFVRKRAGTLWAAAAVAIIWYSSFFQYATEARPYALLLAFFSITLVSWDHAAHSTRRRWAIAGIVTGNSGMLLTHVFAPLSILPLYLAAFIQWRKRRVADWPLWASLTAPMSLGLLYIPMVRRFGGFYFPVEYQASLRNAMRVYLHSPYASIAPGLLAGTLLALWLSQRESFRRGTIQIEDLGLLAGVLISPVLLNLALMRTQGAFFERYCITTVVALQLSATLFLAWRTGFSRLAAIGFALPALVLSTSQHVITPALAALSSPTIAARDAALEDLKPELPFVDASGLTFVEMDHDQSSRFLSRVYYLTDRDSAMKYAHATIFEGHGALKQYIPIRAQVTPYAEFIARHQHFLVLGTVDYPEDWLLRKLLAEGAELRYLGSYPSQYKDSAVYEVNVATNNSLTNNQLQPASKFP